MSGSGGFYKYRCKYFYSHNCPEWVYQNGATCAKCLAEGRDCNETDIVAAPWRFIREICVPLVQDGVLQYILMDIVPSDEPGNYWTLREKPTQAPPPAVMVTTDAPGSMTATAGVSTARY